MNANQPTTGLTRRSFIKRSVVAAVALSTMTIFSGLVRAEGQDYQETCKLTKEPDEWIFDKGNIAIYKCSATGPICDKDMPCGRMFEMDPFTGDPILDPVTHQVTWEEIVVNCAKDRHPLKYCLQNNIA